MKQLNRLDAGFLYMDQPHASPHVMQIWIYDRSTARGGSMRFTNLRDHIASKIHLIPALRKKVVRVLGDIDLPWWIDDPDFDFDEHLHHIALPPPGNWRQLCTIAAEIQTRPPDFDRPLWEMYMIDGLNSIEGVPADAFALVFKVHHAAIDGKVAMAITNTLHSTSRRRQRVQAQQIYTTESPPSAWGLFIRGLSNAASQSKRSAGALSKIAPGIVRMLRDSRSQVSISPNAPETRFGRPVSPYRVMGACFLDLEKLKALRKRTEGATLNDVSLTIFGGALRNYLLHHDELPAIPLRVAIPVALRKFAVADEIGNQISLLSVSLGTDIDDPVERLATICEGTRAAKDGSGKPGTAVLGHMIDIFPAMLMAPGIRLAMLLMSRGLSLGVNTTVSNVAGSREPLYLAGCKMLRSTGSGPAVDGMGLLNYVTSYADSMAFGFTACRKMMPDPERYEICIRESFDSLSSKTNKRRSRRRGSITT